MTEAGVAATTPMFKKKGGGKRDRDVRTRDSAADVAGPSSGASIAGRPEDAASSVVLKKRKAIGSGNPLLQAATGFAKRSKADRDDEEEDDEGYGLDRYGESSVSSVVRSNTTTSDGKQSLSNRQDAVRESDWYDDEGGRSNNPFDRSGGISAAGGTNNNDDGVYRGASSYNTFITPRDDGTSSKLKAATKGPVKGGNNVRTITVVDYQPDVCKDYKETGYCGFGDTCKFMHDRSDYLAGWQLDSLPNSAARQAVDDDGDDDEEEEEIPFACLICRKPFTDPIVTKCGHYFCSACAIKRFSKTSKCFACGKQTQGIFNSAAKVLERMEKARKVKEEEREQRRWNRGQGEEDNSIQESGEIIEGVEIGGVEQE